MHSQVVGMNETEVEQLARHLGHDAKTHKEFYRLSHSAVQLSKVDMSFHINFSYFLFLSLRQKSISVVEFIVSIWKTELQVTSMIFIIVQEIY